MILGALKQSMLLPNREIFINKMLKTRDMEVLVISITSEDHRNTLWAMYRLRNQHDGQIDEEERIEYASNRDEKIRNFHKERITNHLYISEITIQQQKMVISSSSAGSIYDMNYEKLMQLQHFVEKGMTTTNWDEEDLNNLVIASYEQKENGAFPEIDLSKELDLTIKIHRDLKPVLINQPIHLAFGEMEKGNKFYFYDSIEKKNRVFYVDKIESYDIWEEENQRFEDDKMRVLPEEQLKQMKENYLACIEMTCPKGMNLAMLEYETEDDIQLDFYSKEYLDEKPTEHASSCGIFFRPENEFGKNGYKSRLCLIKPIEKDFCGNLDVELFSMYIQIPEEIVIVAN